MLHVGPRERKAIDRVQQILGTVAEGHPKMISAPAIRRTDVAGRKPDPMTGGIRDESPDIFDGKSDPETQSPVRNLEAPLWEKIAECRDERVPSPPELDSTMARQPLGEREEPRRHHLTRNGSSQVHQGLEAGKPIDPFDVGPDPSHP